MAIILEVIAGVTTLGLLLARLPTSNPITSKPTTEPSYGTFCVCYTKKTTHIPWKTCIYKTRDEYEEATDELCKLAFDPQKNFYLREKGFDGVAIINLEDGREEYWCKIIS